MSRLVLIALLAASITPLSPRVSEADVIARACLGSERPGANPNLCRCIQRTADTELSRADQRLVARFFRDPQEAQDIRRSDRPRDEAFWERYERFGARAADACG